MVVSGSSGTDWKGILFGFALGLVGALVAEWWRDAVRRRRLVRALRAEISRLRSIAVGVAWEFALSKRAVTAEIVKRTLRVIDSDPIRAQQMGTALQNELREIANDASLLAAFNKKASARGPLVPPMLPTPVFASQNEVLGYLAETAASAILTVYVAIPGMNGLAEAIGANAGITRHLPVNIENIALAMSASAQVEQDQETLGKLYEIFISDCDRVLELLKRS